MSINNDETTRREPYQDPDDEGRFNRGLRVVFVVLLVLSILSGYATRPTIHQPMRRVLRNAKIVEVLRQTPSWQRPMLSWPKRPLLVRHRTTVDPHGGPVAMESVFTAHGRYLGSRSIIDPPRHQMRSREQLEHILIENHERYDKLTQLPDAFSLPNYWERIGQTIDLRWMTAFRTFPVLFEPDTRTDVEPIPAMVLQLWCKRPANYDAIRDDNGKMCPQARRLILNLQSGDIIRDDYLL